MRKRNKLPLLEQVLVEDYAAEGKSLARLDGKVIFISDAVPGDLVDVRLSKSKKDWAEGRAIHHHRYSPDRTLPFCEHFGVCGGCQWQMLPYQQQLNYKEKQVIETLRRIGRLDLHGLEPILAAEEQRYYRNKMEYTFGTRRYLLPEELNDETVSAEQPVAGFHARGMFDKLVNINKCHLQQEPTNKIRIAARDFALERGYTFYDIRNHQGFMRNMQLRICRSGEIMVNIVFGEDKPEWRDELMAYLLKEFPEVSTFLYTLNRKWNDSLHDQSPVVYSGKGYVIETLEEFQFKIGPKSFFQTNTAQAERLYQIVRDFAGLTGKELLYDLYCGTGSIGIFCSRLAKKVIGVEMIEEAVKDARENAAINQIDHASFFAGDVAAVCTAEFFNREGRPDVIITDPPRAGMHEDLVKQILQMEAGIVVYVSCNPATQARDLALLSEKYAVERIRPVDMFPHTLHIENIVKLRLKNNLA